MSTVSLNAASAWPPPSWTVDDCLAWLGGAGAELTKTFDTAEARNAVGRWVRGSGGSSKRRTARYDGALTLGARDEGQRARRTGAKRGLHGEAYHADLDAVMAPNEGQSDEHFGADLKAARHEDQTAGKVALQAHVDGDDDDASVKEKLMDSYDTDRRNKPGWLSGRAAVEDRKHVENAVDDYIANRDPDQTFDDGDVLHVSVARSKDARFHAAAEAHAAHLKSQGMKDGRIAKEVSGEADEARDAAKLKASAEKSDAAEKDRHATLKAAYPKEFAEAMSGGNKGFKLFQLGNRYQRETGKKLTY